MTSPPALGNSISPTGPRQYPGQRENSSVELNPANEYSIQWTGGPFDLTLKRTHIESGCVPCVVRSTGKHTCAGLRRVIPSDFLTHIGPFNTLDLGFKNVTKRLRTIEKPVVLKFHAVA